MIEQPQGNIDRSGKLYDWRPLKDPNVALGQVAEDERPEMMQVAHYAMLCVAMQATLDETGDIMKALQHCERTHGFRQIAPTLPTITAAVDNAVYLIQISISFMGMQQQLATPGLFIGSLVEQLASIPGQTRKFPLREYRERIRSPHVEFEDCLLGAGLAKKMGILSESAPHLSRPYSRLMTEFRRKYSHAGALMLDELAHDIQEKYTNSASNERVSAFVRAVALLASKKKLGLPPQWRLYVDSLKP